VGFSKGDDPLYLQISENIGPFYLTPMNAFNRVFPDVKTSPDALTVINWILPQTGETKRDHRKERIYPSERWARSRLFGENFNSKLRREVASFNAGSINFALFPVMMRYKEWKFEWERQYLGMTEDFIYANTFKSMKEYCGKFNETGTKPEFEIFDAGMVNNVAFMIQAGYVKKPVYIQFVMGVLGGITPSPENLLFLVDYAKKLIGDFEFSVCVAGRAQFPICTQSLLIGGNARVGLEDNLYLEKGQVAKSNAEQVAKMVRIARELGIDPATPDEARSSLGLKGIDKVNF
jgi:uncharacterized protein (DUF849 family)